MSTTAPPSTALQVEPLVIANRTFHSRLILGTGKYKDGAEMNSALDASGTEMVTVALRTARLARELGGWDFVKLEVFGDEKTLFPDNEASLEAGWLAAHAGRIPRKLYATASSPLDGLID